MTSRLRDDKAPRTRYLREVKPSFIIKPRRQFVDEGQTAKLKSSFDGDPTPTLTWDRNGATITEGGRYKLYEKNDFHFMEVSDVTSDDMGTYTAIITNEHGTAECSAQLEVYCKPQLKTWRKAPPKVEKPLQDISVNDCDLATFECTITGNPESTVSWYHNKRLLKSSEDIKQAFDGKKATLTFTEVYPEDAGTYEVVAKNSQGDVKSTAKLTVKELKPKDVAPTFTDQLQNVSSEEGVRVTLTCVFSGLPEPSVTWYKDREELQPAPNYRFSVVGSKASLVIKRPRGGDTGTYECVAENTAGEARTRCKVSIKETPKDIAPTITRQLEDVSKDEGSRVTLECAFDGLPEPKVTWFKEGQELKASPSYRFMFNGSRASLVVKRSGDSDSGTYTCTAKNSAGEVHTRSKVTVIVKPKEICPSVTQPLQNMREDEGNSIKMACSFTGLPVPSVKWFKDGREVKPSPDFRFDHDGSNASMVVKQSISADTGIYECVAQNVAGEARTKCRVTIIEEEPPPKPAPPPPMPRTAPPRGKVPKGPIFVKELTDMTVVDSDRVEMQVEIEGVQPMEVIWLHGDKEIKKNNTVYQVFSEGTTHRLVIPEVFPEDGGMYVCEAYNEEGDEDSACQLFINESAASRDEENNSHTVHTSFHTTVLKTAPKPVETSRKVENDTVHRSVFTITPKTIPKEESPKQKTVVKSFTNRELEPESQSHIVQKSTRKISTRKQPALPEPEFDEEPEFLAKPILKPSKRPIPKKISEPEPEFLAKPVLKPSKRPMPVKVHEPEPEFLAKPILKPSRRQLPAKESEPRPEFLSKPVLKPSRRPVLQRASEPEPEFLAKPILKPSQKPASHPIPKTEPEFLHKSVLKRTSRYVPPTPPKPSVSDEPPSEEVHYERSPDHQDVTSYTAKSRWRQRDKEAMVTPEEEDDQDHDHDQDNHKVYNSRSYGSEPEDDEYDMDGDEIYPPEFLKKPKSVHIDEGSMAVYTCCIAANPKPAVVWEKDGVEIPPGGRFKIMNEGNIYTFEIPHCLATDAGRYVVMASNSEGSERYSVSLMVKELESSEASDFRSLLKSSPSKAKDYSIRPQLKNLGAAAIEPEKEAEQVDFRNVLTRHVQTKQRPKLARELQDVKVGEGESATLQCKIVAVPKPRVAWFLNKNKEIKESKFFKMTFENNIAQLVIAEVYPEDEGAYLCKAVNEAGMVQTTCDVTVISDEPAEDHLSAGHPSLPASGPPAVIEAPVEMEPPFIEDLSPDNIHVLRGSWFSLTAKFLAEPDPVVKWFKDKQELHTGARMKIDVERDSSILTLNDVEAEDSGRYTLIVENELGRDTCDSSVTVDDRPNPPSGRPAASNIRGTSLTLSWYGPSYDGGSCVTHYRIEMCKVTDMDWQVVTDDCKYTSYLVNNLEPNTEYCFRTSASNKHGSSDPGRMSEVFMTVDQRQSSQRVDMMPFEPRNVTINPDRNFHDHYSLGPEIGRGRFGSVYKCTDRETRGEFAAKFIKVKPSQREETRQEIAVMNELHHPKLLLLWDGFESAKQIVLIMEHVAGGELFERIIDDDYYLTEKECVHFMRQICDGVAYMHQNNILHLDLKPENVLCITPNSNEIKIIDFGLARKFDPKNKFKVMFGTPEFVAPEVVNYETIDYATDMWSVGVICYILLSGLSPFLGENEAETLVNVTMGQWDFEDEAFDDISDDAKEFLEGLLNKTMKHRLPSEDCLDHKWLSQDVKYMRAKRLSTEKHKRFMARRKWQSGEFGLDPSTEEQDEPSHDPEKTGNAIRALGRMASFQKALSGNMMRGPNSTDSGTDTRSRQGSLTSDNSDASSGTNERPLSNLVRQQRMQSEEYKITERDSGIEALSPEGNSSEDEKSSHREANSGTGLDATTRAQAQEDQPEADINANSKSATNGHAQTDDDPAAPCFLKKMRDFEVFEGDSARFDVRVTGSPEPEVTWYKEDEEMKEDRRYVIDYHEDGLCSLIIKNCQEDDDATYKCSVHNSNGEASCTADLYVETTGMG